MKMGISERERSGGYAEAEVLWEKMFGRNGSMVYVINPDRFSRIGAQNCRRIITVWNNEAMSEIGRTVVSLITA